MTCEIEFLPVGDASKAGDAIVIRYGEPEAYELMLVDGGTLDTGDAIVAHLHAHFGAGARLSHMVLTHSDADHASGLRKVLEDVPATNLWLHIPWFHAEEALPWRSWRCGRRVRHAPRWRAPPSPARSSA